ncbi:MAG: hypothetical protein H7836_01960 [Magnetococcus sp. YQC-3]
MVEIRFQVRGKNNKSGHNNKLHEVVFIKAGEKIMAHCSCTKGVDAICQHRINILYGSTQDIISKNADEVKTVASWIGGTDIALALHEMLHFTNVIRNATDNFNDARKRLGKAMQGSTARS